MYIINVIPFTKIPRPNPQILSYFTIKKLNKWAIVSVLIRKKEVNALVFSCENLEKKKIEIKKRTNFNLKPIKKVICENPVLTSKQSKLLFWFSEYYFCSLGTAIKLFVPQKFIKAKKIIKNHQISVINDRKLVLRPENKKDVFRSFKNINSITIENAHSFKYHSWGRRPYYDTKIIAFELAKIFKAQIFIKAESPPITTYYRAKKNNYKISLDFKKPVIKSSVVDMKKEIKQKNFSIFSEELQKKLNSFKKLILFVPRRGASTFILCRDCGHVLKCEDCDTPLVLHIADNKLRCHHCGKVKTPPSLCPNCSGHRIKYFGVGTQKVEAELKKLNLKNKIFRLDSDIAPKAKNQQEIINKFNKSKKAILIGTQMMFEKNINSVNFVSALSIETILNLPNYKSAERVFQILINLQLMAKKEFLLQAYSSENHAVKFAIDRNFKKFYNKEIELRKLFNYPPFSQLIKLTFEHRDSKKAKDETGILFEKLKIQSKVQNLKSKIQLLGPIPAFIPRIANKFRWNIIIKSKIKNIKKRNKLLRIVPAFWQVDIDSESLL